MKKNNLTLHPELVFSILSDTTRLRCLTLIKQAGELCVCELAYALNMVQPKVSRHLALLRKLNFVTDSRRGIWIYYSINQDLPGWVYEVFDAFLKAVRKVEPYNKDSKRLVSMPDRPKICLSP